MNPALLRRFSERAATERMNLVGVEVEFRGEFMRAIITPNDPSVTLQSGGLKEDATFRVRLPGSLIPAPALKEKIREVGTGRIFHVTGIIAANPQNPLAQEHVVGAQLA